MIQQINYLTLEQKAGLKKSDESPGMCNANIDIKFRTSMTKASLCSYSNA